MGRFLKVGALAGGAGGLALALFLRFVGEGTIGEAIAIERSKPGVHEEMFARGTQQLGGMVGAVLYGVFVGLIVAVVFAAVRHRMHGRDDWRRSVTLAAVGFVTIALVPFLKYPANPPSVGDPDTISKRTTLYFLMMALSVLLAIAATILGKRLAPSLGTWYATVTAVAAFAVVIGLSFAFLPVVNEVPKDFPATLLWRFRLSALAIQTVLWGGFGLVFGELAERMLNPKPAAASSGRAVPAAH
jgi:putative cobalt transporter subunit CbtA